MVTSLALGIAVEEGLASWDDTIQKHLPTFDPSEDPDMGKEATLIDACRHSTGLANPNAVYMGAEGSLKIDGKDHVALMNAVPTSNQSGQRFGKWWYYSNAAFGLVACVIEACSKTTFSQFLRSRLLNPLGLTQTLVSEDEVSKNTDIAYSYAKMTDNEWKRIENGNTQESYPAVLACMGVRSYVNDLLTLLAAVMNRFDEDRDIHPPGPLLHGKTANPLGEVFIMWDCWWNRPMDDGFENNTQYLLGWYRTTTPSGALGIYSFNHHMHDDAAFGHNGISSGSTATAYCFPETHSAVVALSNGSDWGDAAKTTSQILIQALFDLKPHIELVPSVMQSRDLGQRAWTEIMTDWNRDRDASKYTGAPADYVGTYVGLDVSKIRIVPSGHAKAGAAVVFGDNEDTRHDLEGYNVDTLSFLPMTHDEILARGMIDWDYYKVGLFEFVPESNVVLAFWWRWNRYDWPGVWTNETPGMTEESRDALVKRLGGLFRKSEDIS